MADDLGSRSDLEALQRSGRGKVALLALMLLLALAAAGWWFFGKKEGIGSREDPTKVLVVRAGQVSGYASVLESKGFDAAEGDLSYWIEKARSQMLDLEVDGIEAVVQLADQFGYGYIVFEDPASVDFAPLELDDVPVFEEHVRFAVLSVGDFAFPPVMTVDPPPNQTIRSTEISLLQALFEQEKLARLVTDDPKDLGVEEILLHDRLEKALHELQKLPAAEKLAERVLGDAQRVLVEDERGDPVPSLVGGPLEDGVAVPLPSGDVLAWSRALRVVTPDAVRVELEQVEMERFLHGAATAAPDDRRACTLAGGELPSTEAVRIDFAPDGSAALVKTLAEGTNLWVHTAGTPCTFENLGPVPPPGTGYEKEPPVPHASGKVAQAGYVDGSGRIRIATAGVPDETILGTTFGPRIGGVVWLDEGHLAALGVGPSVFLFSIAKPQMVLEIEGMAFDGATFLGELAVVGGSKRDLLVTAGHDPRKLYRLRLPADPAQLFADPPRLELDAPAEPVDGDAEADTDPAIPPDEPYRPIELDPAKLEITALTHEGIVTNPSSSPDGTQVVFAIVDRSIDRPDAADDEEIAVLSLAGGGLRVLTRNGLEDGQPRFTADGRHVVFLTRAEIPKTRWQITVPRVVPVGR